MCGVCVCVCVCVCVGVHVNRLDFVQDHLQCTSSKKPIFHENFFKQKFANGL